jgi:hypothetical protein
MAISGQKTVTSPGSDGVALGDRYIHGPLLIKALNSNTTPVYVGNAGDNTVSSATGIPLAAGQYVYFPFVSHLANLYLDADTAGEGVAWIVLSV